MNSDDEQMPAGERIALAAVMLIGFLALLSATTVAWTRWLP